MNLEMNVSMEHCGRLTLAKLLFDDIRDWEKRRRHFY